MHIANAWGQQAGLNQVYLLSSPSLFSSYFRYSLREKSGLWWCLQNMGFEESSLVDDKGLLYLLQLGGIKSRPGDSA